MGEKRGGKEGEKKRKEGRGWERMGGKWGEGRKETPSVPQLTNRGDATYKISYQYCQLSFHLRLDKEQLPLLTQRPTLRHLVNDECVVTDGSVLYSLHRYCLVHTANSCKNEGQFSCDRVIIWMCFLCLLAKQHLAFNWKDVIFSFLFFSK